MEEDIKILEDFIKYFEAEAISTKYRRNISITVGEDDIQAIENLIKGYRELEKEIDLNKDRIVYKNKEIKRQENEICILQNEVFFYKKELGDYETLLKKDYILKSKIKEKIEELDNASVKEEYVFYKLSSEDIRRTIKTVLQELMEDK